MPKKDPATELFTADDATVKTEENEESLELPTPDDPFGADTSGSSVEDQLINDILSLETTEEDIAARQAALYLETGNYQWVRDENFDVNVTFSDKDIHRTDIAQKKGVRGKGRCYIKVSGTVVNENSKKGAFEFSCSPDVRKMNDRADFFTKNYDMVEKLFFQKYERNPKSPQEIVNMLREAKYSMYITLGNGRNYLNRITKL